MKNVKDNIVEILLFLGIALISIGAFIFSAIAGFVVTGLAFMWAAKFIVENGGD